VPAAVGKAAIFPTIVPEAQPVAVRAWRTIRAGGEDPNVTTLRQMPDGTWYRFGEGIPERATAQEIELWTNAQRQAFESVEGPKSGWEQAAELAKFSTITIALLTFLALLSDWISLSAFHQQLGTSDLAFERFMANPIHQRGVIHLISFVAFAAAPSITGLAFVLVKRTQGKQNRDNDSPIKPSILLIVIFFMFLIVTVCLSPDKIETAMMNISILPIYFAIGSWLKEPQERNAKDPLNRLSRESSKIASIVFAALWIFLIAFLTLPAWRGSQEAEELTQGTMTYPPVSIIANCALNLPSGIVQITESGKQYLYATQVITLANTSSGTYSLQTLGKTNEALYVYELQRDLVHRVPLDALKNIVFYPNAFSASAGILPAKPSVRALPPLTANHTITTTWVAPGVP
jgi:hypothetical protein